MNAIQKAIELAGGISALASQLGISPPTVHQWASGKRPIPALRCPQIEQITKRVVTCEDLRPDVRWDVLRAKPAPQPVDSAQAATETIAPTGTDEAGLLRSGGVRRQQATRRAAEFVAVEPVDRREPRFCSLDVGVA